MTIGVDRLRRQLLLSLPAVAAVCSCPMSMAGSANITRTIPSTGEKINPVGMGTWRTFNVGRDNYLRQNCSRVMARFFAMGGQLIDSSPMYGSSEQVLGYCLKQLNFPSELFSATKVWTHSVSEGREQFEDSTALWQQPTFDLLQIHNLLGWQEHLAVLREYKQQGLIRYLGITTSHGRRHQELEEILKHEAIDFVQLTYNLMDREAEQRLLPMAADAGVGVIVNRPFQGGLLFNRFANKPLPEISADIGCSNWAQLFLRFVLAHPAVTCVIPATSQVAHMIENMGASGSSVLPDLNQRKAILKYLKVA